MNHFNKIKINKGGAKKKEDITRFNCPGYSIYKSTLIPMLLALDDALSLGFKWLLTPLCYFFDTWNKVGNYEDQVL